MKKGIIIILLIAVLPVSSMSQDEATRIWTPDLVELWIYWHKKQYNMFNDFLHREDSLNTLKYEDLQKNMKSWSDVCKILFSQYQNNEVPLPFFTSSAGDAIQDLYDLLTVCDDIVTLATSEPVNSVVINHAVQFFNVTSLELVSIYYTWNKATEANAPTNLRDNQKRDDILNGGLKRLKSLTTNGHTLYTKLSVAKYSDLLNF